MSRHIFVTWCAVAIAFLGLLFPGIAPAQSASRSALIVGVSVYSSSDIATLEGVPFDMVSARQIARAMGIPDNRMSVLRDAQATKRNIVEALEKLSAEVSEGSRVFVYFSGHGTRWWDENLKGCREGLLAYDRETLTNEEIAQRTRRMGEVADKVVVLFDACHSDGVTANRLRARSVASGRLTPKFFLKAGADADACSRPTNLRARSVVAEATKLGALQENYVQITSARADEVSFDEPGKGGLATQGMRQCLLSKASDRDGSGASSIDEIQQCAQRIVEDKLKPFPELKPHHITVTGNRNIVPVAVPRPPQPAPVGVAPVPPHQPPQPVLPPLAVAPPPSPPAPTPSPAPAPVAPPLALPPVAVAPVPPPPAPPPQEIIASPAAPPIPAPPEPEPALASLATLKDIEQQRNPRRRVEVNLSRTSLRIGKDPLALRVTSSHPGHVYLVMLGSDRKSFYVLFPNALDADNRIEAGKPLALPRPDWKLMAQGPAGTNHLLVMVTDTPRNLAALTALPPTSAAPFTFALNDLPGRTALLDFFIGSGITGTSETFGAKLLSLQEVK